MRHLKNMLVIAALAATAIAGSWAVSMSQGPTGTGYPGGSSSSTDTMSTGSGTRSGSSTHTQSGTRTGSTTRTKSKSSTSATRHPGARASSTTSEETGGTVSGDKWSSSTTESATTAYERSVLASGTHKSVSGEVIEVSCYLQLGQHGAANATAMRDFAEHGGQVGILTTDRTLYLVYPEEYQSRRDGSINTATAMSQEMGKNVTMTGTVVVQKGVRGFFVSQSEINRFGGGAAGGSSTSPGGGVSTPGGGGGTYEGTTPGGSSTTPGGTMQQPGGGGMMRDTSSTNPGTGTTNPGGSTVSPGGSSTNPGGSSTNPSGSPYPGGTQGGTPDSTGRTPGGVDSTGTRPPR